MTCSGGGRGRLSVPQSPLSCLTKDKGEGAQCPAHSRCPRKGRSDPHPGTRGAPILALPSLRGDPGHCCLLSPPHVSSKHGELREERDAIISATVITARLDDAQTPLSPVSPWQMLRVAHSKATPKSSC